MKYLIVALSVWIVGFCLGYFTGYLEGNTKGYDTENFRTYDTGNYFLRPIDYLEGEEHRDNVPAWSLHRLIAMYPDFVIAEQRNHEKLYEEVIANIKFAIEEGSFDEKYLE